MLKIISLMAREKLLIPVEEKASNYSSAKTELMKEMVSYLQSHYGEKITLESMAKKIPFVSKYFCRFLRVILGKHGGIFELFPYGTGREIFVETDQRILDISLRVGFENFSYFIKIQGGLRLYPLQLSSKQALKLKAKKPAGERVSPAPVPWLLLLYF